MAVHSIYAQISEGIVQNIMVCDNYELANELTRASYGDDGFAVECNQCPCVTSIMMVDFIGILKVKE